MANKKGFSLRVRLPEPHELALQALRDGGHINNTSTWVRECVRDKARECLPFWDFAKFFPREASEELQSLYPEKSKDEIAEHIKILRCEFIDSSDPEWPAVQETFDWLDDN